jgi:hypothetical protein
LAGTSLTKHASDVANAGGVVSEMATERAQGEVSISLTGAGVSFDPIAMGKAQPLTAIRP